MPAHVETVPVPPLPSVRVNVHVARPVHLVAVPLTCVSPEANDIEERISAELRRRTATKRVVAGWRECIMQTAARWEGKYKTSMQWKSTASSRQGGARRRFLAGRILVLSYSLSMNSEAFGGSSGRPLGFRICSTRTGSIFVRTGYKSSVAAKPNRFRLSRARS
jgi:hypothetical protein